MGELSPNLTRRTVVLAKTEGTYGSAPTFDETTDAMLIFGDGAGVYSPNIGLIDYQALTGTVTRQPMKSGAKTAAINLNTCLMVSAAAKDSPAADPNKATFFDPLLKACGLVLDTATANTHEWRPMTTTTGTDPESVAFEVYTDGIKQVVTGAMGSFTLNCTAGDIPRLNFAFQGKYNSPVTGTVPSANYPVDRKSLVGATDSLIITRNSATVPATGEDSVNGNVAAQNPVVRSLSLNSGNAVAAKSDINAADGFAGFHIPDRRPTMNITFECEKNLSTYSPINDLEDSITHSISFTHTTPVASSVGTNCKTVITAPQAQLTNVSYSDDGGIRMYNCSYALTHNEGDASVDNREYVIANSFTVAP